MHISSERVRFGAFELDLSTGELRSIEALDPNNPSPNDRVLLREQVFQVLQMLVEREGKIVTREEIKGKLWPGDTVVDFDHSINATIKALRRALGDSADSPQYIETLARRGYRLMVKPEYLQSMPEIASKRSVAEIHSESNSIGEKKISADRILNVIALAIPWAWKVLVAVVLLVASALIVWRYHIYRHRITLTPTDTIVLADVDNRTADPVFDDALNIALRYEMAQTP